MKRRHIIITLVVLLGAGLLFFLFVEPEIVVAHWDRWDNVQITGRLVDPYSGEPHAGIRIMTLWEPEDADNEERVRERQALARRQVDMIAEEAGRGHDTSTYCPGPNGLTTSDDDGRFTFCVNVLYGGMVRDGISSNPREPPPFHGVKALLLQWPDGRRAVVDTTEGKWTVVAKRDLHATLEMGTIRAPAP